MGKVCSWHLASVAISASQHPTMHEEASAERHSNQNGKKVTVGNVNVASTCDLLLSARLRSDPSRNFTGRKAEIKRF